jgi:hypothetical protein
MWIEGRQCTLARTSSLQSCVGRTRCVGCCRTFRKRRSRRVTFTLVGDQGVFLHASRGFFVSSGVNEMENVSGYVAQRHSLRCSRLSLGRAHLSGWGTRLSGGRSVVLPKLRGLEWAIQLEVGSADISCLLSLVRAGTIRKGCIFHGCIVKDRVARGGIGHTGGIVLP